MVNPKTGVHGPCIYGDCLHGDSIHNYCVWATRPEAQNSGWIGVLRRRYKNVIDLPLMEIRPVELDSERRLVANLVMKLDEYSHIIFVSQNAVKYGFESIENYWPQQPVGLNFYAIGAKTAKQLQFYVESNQVYCASGEMTSEELLRHSNLSDVTGAKILIFRGVGGRPLLAETLVEKGAQVDICELYHRKLPEESLSQIYLNKDTIVNKTNIVPVFSAESFRNFVQVIGQGLVSDTTSFKFVVPSERVKTAVLAQGYKKAIVADNATEEKMIFAIDSCIHN